MFLPEIENGFAGNSKLTAVFRSDLPTNDNEIGTNGCTIPEYRDFLDRIPLKITENLPLFLEYTSAIKLVSRYVLT